MFCSMCKFHQLIKAKCTKYVCVKCNTATTDIINFKFNTNYLILLNKKLNACHMNMEVYCTYFYNFFFF